MVKPFEDNTNEHFMKTKENGGDTRLPGCQKSYIGFGNLPNQLHKKITEKGIQFNILVIGESGIGCTTLINSLFNAKIMIKQTLHLPNAKKISIDVTEVVLTENHVKFHLRIFRVRNFGDLIDNSDCWSIIEKCITDRFDEYFNAESSLDRPRVLDDCRIHCCLYLIRSNLRQIDLQTLKTIMDHVAIVPVITKGDCFTAEEIRSLKADLMDKFLTEMIKIFDFYSLDMHASEKASLLTEDMARRVPFAVVASEEVCKIEDRSIRGRSYDWGIVEADNLKHSDLHALRYLLLCVGLPELIRYTDSVAYKRYRSWRISYKREPTAVNNPISQLENERISMENKIREAEQKMDDLFQSKICQKTAMLEESQTAYELKIKVHRRENADRRDKLEVLKTNLENDMTAMIKEYPSFSSFKLKKDRKKSTIKLSPHQ